MVSVVVSSAERVVSGLVSGGEQSVMSSSKICEWGGGAVCEVAK